jgi:hypothetical protein
MRQSLHLKDHNGISFMTTWQYRTARVKAWTDDGIGHYTLTGVVTRKELRAVLRDAADWQANSGALVALRDLTGALQSVPLRDYLDETSEVMGKACPAVIIPPPQQEAYYRAFAIDLCSRGIGRVVRRDYRTALDWARETAALRAIDASHPVRPGSAKSPAPASGAGTHRSASRPSVPSDWAPL